MNDLISRQEAIDVLDVGAELLKRVLDDTDVVGAEREKYKWGLGLIESYISDMKELPPAQPERKKGHWQEDPSGHGFWICSACGFVSEASCADLLYNFCPHCGANMRGESDGQI